jgi:hypothetical protein
MGTSARSTRQNSVQGRAGSQLQAIDHQAHSEQKKAQPAYQQAEGLQVDHARTQSATVVITAMQSGSAQPAVHHAQQRHLLGGVDDGIRRGSYGQHERAGRRHRNSDGLLAGLRLPYTRHSAQRTHTGGIAEKGHKFLSHNQDGNRRLCHHSGSHASKNQPRQAGATM